MVDWTNINNVKRLLHAIIVTNDGSVNYEKVAKVFGTTLVPRYLLMDF